MQESGWAGYRPTRSWWLEPQLLRWLLGGPGRVDLGVDAAHQLSDRDLLGTAVTRVVAVGAAAQRSGESVVVREACEVLADAVPREVGRAVCVVTDMRRHDRIHQDVVRVVCMRVIRGLGLRGALELEELGKEVVFVAATEVEVGTGEVHPDLFRNGSGRLDEPSVLDAIGAEEDGVSQSRDVPRLIDDE